MLLINTSEYGSISIFVGSFSSTKETKLNIVKIPFKKSHCPNSPLKVCKSVSSVILSTEVVAIHTSVWFSYRVTTPPIAVILQLKVSPAVKGGVEKEPDITETPPPTRTGLNDWKL